MKNHAVVWLDGIKQQSSVTCGFVLANTDSLVTVADSIR